MAGSREWIMAVLLLFSVDCQGVCGGTWEWALDQPVFNGFLCTRLSVGKTGASANLNLP